MGSAGCACHTLGVTPSGPTPNGAIGGRDARGRFAKGNSGGPGNPHVRRVSELRAGLVRAAKPRDLRDVVRALLKAAKTGDVQAARELLSRLLGPPVADDLAIRLAELEKRVEEVAGGAQHGWAVGPARGHASGCERPTGGAEVLRVVAGGTGGGPAPAGRGIGMAGLGRVQSSGGGGSGPA
jgi:hypothetical protein